MPRLILNASIAGVGTVGDVVDVDDTVAHRLRHYSAPVDAPAEGDEDDPAATTDLKPGTRDWLVERAGEVGIDAADMTKAEIEAAIAEADGTDGV